MFKILVIDRCYFTRSGMESWLNQTDLFPASFLVTALHNLMLAKEHIVQWQPDLVIADLHGFKNEIHHIQQLASFFSVCSESTQVMLLESGEDAQLSEFCAQFAIQATMLKTEPLEKLAQIIDAMMLARPIRAIPHIATPLLTKQEEKVLTLWMEGNDNQAIASNLSINGKTVYTYKRNIRMKLGMGNRFTPFLSLPENSN
ncbi:MULTISPECIES: LuxR C-terminal-related transcriptional regulator [Kosakonia]|uniref:Response regulator transcription factor n=1 Tax=Kosakonia quasisacchari TaxID=2529380 RepID=A0A4R0HU30_9ENTR|nr:LuxR C-terminal-related transcriptional regulator [Kosakonia quasisacchari]TCC13854.1 response regulator transcription factor [Kosakonia quasisacchari]